MAVSSAASALSALTQNVTAPTNGLKRAKNTEVATGAESAQKASQAWVQKNLTEKLRAEFRQKVLEQKSLADQAADQMTAAGRHDTAQRIIAYSDSQHPKTASQGELESRAKAVSGQDVAPPATLLDLKV